MTADRGRTRQTSRGAKSARRNRGGECCRSAPLPPVRPIRYADRTVALCAGDHVLLAPEIAALESDHPTRRFVSMLCVFSAEVDAGTAPDGACGYSPGAAERYARDQLVPDELFCLLAHRPDHELAEAFVAPLEQIARKRRDLADS
jgi:hypothetical protein